MATQRLQLPVTLRSGPDCNGDCAQCIEERLSHRPGIRGIRVIDDRNGHRPDPVDAATRIGTLELDYDPHQVSLAEINRYLRQTGGCLHESLAHLVLKVKGIVTPRQEQAIGRSLSKLPGVHATASFASQTVRIEFDRNRCALPEIVRRLERQGVVLLPMDRPEAQGGDATTGRRPGRPAAMQLPAWWREAMGNRELVLAVIGAAFLIAGASVHLADGPQWLRLALLAVAYVTTGWFTAIDSIRTLLRFQFDIDVLMFAAALGAASLGHFEEGALLLLLFALGGAGEELAIGRARGAIRALAALAPQTATVLDDTVDSGHREMPVEKLAIGDRVLVRPGQRIPADGRIIEGASAVDQSPITGESVPIEKVPGDTVYAGTINSEGRLIVEVSKLASDNTIAKVIRMVEEAQATRSPTQVFTDRVEKWYVPFVLGTTALLILLPPLLGWGSRHHPDSRWAGWFYQAMAFLTAASPCALAIGTPAAVLCGIARAARSGVLIKGGIHLENLGRAHVMAFDKTGTLTVGRAEVCDVIALEPAHDEASLLVLAAAVERNSDHPLAKAIVAEADARELARLDAQAVEQTPGLGIMATVQGRRVRLGRAPANFDDDPIARAMQQHVASLSAEGKTCVVMDVDGRPVGLISLADRPRPLAAQALNRLRKLGVQRTIMLTGDNARVAQVVAGQVGVDECLSELMPEDKLRHVRQLDERYGRVAMVGDGVNDAPAMAHATVGIAVGGASGGASDVALETADVVLLADDLAKLAQAVSIGRRTRRIIMQNLVFALGVIAIVAPLSALGFATLYAAVLLHEGSTVLVVLNALRLLRHRDA